MHTSTHSDVILGLHLAGHVGCVDDLVDCLFLRAVDHPHQSPVVVLLHFEGGHYWSLLGVPTDEVLVILMVGKWANRQNREDWN